MLNFKHTVILICYNQEKYISDALESILISNEPPYELLVYDDCSTDRTLEFIENFKNKFPNILKLHSNKKNIGLYENIQKASQIFNGDIVHLIAGDDLIGDNLISEIDSIVTDSGYDPSITNFISLPKIKLLKLNNEYNYIKTNQLLLEKYNLDYLAATKRIYWQNKGISSSMMKLWGDYRIGNKECGIYSDYIHSILFFSHSPIIINIENSFDVHRIGSGVTSTNFNIIFLSFFKACSYINNTNYGNRYKLSNQCIQYIKYEETRGNFTLNKTFLNFLKLIKCSLLIIYKDFYITKTVLLNFYSSLKFKQNERTIN